MKELARALATAVLLLAFAGCAGLPLPAGCREQVEYRLYFGADSPLGEVSPAQWTAFLKDSVTPRFPEGLTVYDARGQWRDGNGQIAGEETRVVEILRDGTPDDDARVATVAREYRERFRQESVLATRKAARACF